MVDPGQVALLQALSARPTMLPSSWSHEPSLSSHHPLLPASVGCCLPLFLFTGWISEQQLLPVELQNDFTRPC